MADTSGVQDFVPCARCHPDGSLRDVPRGRHFFASELCEACIDELTAIAE